MTDVAEAWQVVIKNRVASLGLNAAPSVDADGNEVFKAVFADRAIAERYAARVHGVVYPLFYGRRAGDGPEGEP